MQETFYFGTTVDVVTDVASKEACADLSAATEGANFWTYKTSDNNCFLKTSNTSPNSPYAGAVSGNKMCGSNKFAGCIIEQETFYSDRSIEVIHNVASQQACADLCATTEGANFWTWWSSNNRCWLKAFNDSPDRDARAISGNKICGSNK